MEMSPEENRMGMGKRVPLEQVEMKMPNEYAREEYIYQYLSCAQKMYSKLGRVID